MAGSTPIYGFPYPQSTDLVADYPALGQELATDVETVISGLGSGLNIVTPTSIANSGGSASASGGQVTFAGVTSLSLNGVFTSTYRNYVIVARTTCTSDTYMKVRLRTAGTDYSGATYQNQQLSVNSASLTGTREADQTNWNLSDVYTPPTDQQIFIAAPQLAEITTVNTTYCSYAGTVITPVVKIRAGALNTTSQYDGFTFFPNAGNITGTIRVYGLKNS